MSKYAIEIERSTNYGLIRRIVTDPKIYPAVIDDASPQREEYRPVQHPALWYLLVRDGKELLGLFLLVPSSGICCEIHACFLPTAWGPRAAAAAREASLWIVQNSPYRRAVANVPSYNRLALRFAERSGMIRFGVNPKSYQRDGQLFDQIMLGISKDQVISRLPLGPARLSGFGVMIG